MEYVRVDEVCVGFRRLERSVVLEIIQILILNLYHYIIATSKVFLEIWLNPKYVNHIHVKITIDF